jgi:hypothetical protein
MIEGKTTRARWLAVLAAAALFAGACTSGGATTAPSVAPGSDAPATTEPSASAEMMSYDIGYSNGGGVGNGFRE